MIPKKPMIQPRSVYLQKEINAENKVELQMNDGFSENKITNNISIIKKGFGSPSTAQKLSPIKQQKSVSTFQRAGLEKSTVKLFKTKQKQQSEIELFKDQRKGKKEFFEEKEPGESTLGESRLLSVCERATTKSNTIKNAQFVRRKNGTIQMREEVYHQILLRLNRVEEECTYLRREFFGHYCEVHPEICTQTTPSK